MYIVARNNRKIWGFVVVWLIMFFIVKSIEKILLITAVGALVFWISHSMKTLNANRENKKNKSGKRNGDMEK